MANLRRFAQHARAWEGLAVVWAPQTFAPPARFRSAHAECSIWPDSSDSKRCSAIAGCRSARPAFGPGAVARGRKLPGCRRLEWLPGPPARNEPEWPAAPLAWSEAQNRPRHLEAWQPPAERCLEICGQPESAGAAQSGRSQPRGGFATPCLLPATCPLHIWRGALYLAGCVWRGLCSWADGWPQV